MTVQVENGGSDGAAAAIAEAAARIAARGESRPRRARDPVNLPMIRNWAEAIGDANPVYTDAGAAAASPPRACARPAEFSRSAATSSSGPGAACARCQARRSGWSASTSASAA